MTLTPGTLVAARYRLIRQLGQGGMGSVWSATHVVTGKSVALKFLSADVADESSKKRLLREARAACSVRHPHVVQVHDVLEIEGELPVLVMDLLEGESLGDRLERERVVPEGELVRILLQMVGALEAAHARGVVHRDIKPDNVFLVRRPDGALDVKVLDFGIAKVTKLEDGDAAETAKLTGTGAMMGTPYYMAPEQVFGEKDVDARTDLWATGIMIYECASGVRPTEGANLGQILKLVTVGPFTPLAQVASGVSPGLARVVDMCLERDRTRRVPTATALREALERVAAGTTLDGAEVASAHARTGEVSVQPAPRRSKAPAFVAAAVLLLGLVGGGAALVTRRPPPVPAVASTGALVESSPKAPPTAAPSAESIATPVAPPSAAIAPAAATSAAPSARPAPARVGKHAEAKPAASTRGPGGVVLTPPPNF
ncbi:MAG: serine/threonine-protein kinase [Polyangiaceae bacterium]